MPQRVLIRVEQYTLLVVVACAAVGVQREDVGPDDALDVEVRGLGGVAVGREAEDGHLCSSDRRQRGVLSGCSE